jgi:hypothetical protein
VTCDIQIELNGTVVGKVGAQICFVLVVCVSGEPPLPTLRTVFHPDPLQMVFHPDRLWTLQMVFRPVLWILLCSSIQPSNHLGHLSALAGTCYVIRPMITVDTSRHVLLGSYQLVYKVLPSMGILILSSLRIPPLVSMPCAKLKVAFTVCVNSDLRRLFVSWVWASVAHLLLAK